MGPRRAAVPAGRDRRPRAPPLHHQPSARHGRRADRGPSRPAGADALSASAGAVGLRPHPQGDEPPPHGRRVSRADRAHPRRPARHGACRAISSSAFPARPMRISRRRWSSCDEVGYAAGLLVQIFAAPRHARRRHDDQVPEAVKTERLQRLQALLAEQQRDFSRRAGRHGRSTCCSRSPAAQPGQIGGRSP